MTDTNRLKSVMALYGQTQKTMAKEIGISRTAFSNKLNNKSPFNQAEISIISKVLKLKGTDINRIFFAA